MNGDKHETGYLATLTQWLHRTKWETKNIRLSYRTIKQVVRIEFCMLSLTSPHSSSPYKQTMHVY